MTVNTIEKPGEFDALPKLEAGEPYFALRGRDPLAPGLVLDWARQRRETIFTSDDTGKLSEARRAEELRQATQAEEIAWAMRNYQAGRPVDDEEPAVTVEAPITTYSGHKLPADCERRNREISVRAKSGDRLDNAVCAMMEQADAMAEFDGEAAAALRGLADQARAVAETIRPARPALERAHG